MTLISRAFGKISGSSPSLVSSSPIKNSTSTQHLALEILQRIYSFLPREDVASCRDVSRFWRDASVDLPKTYAAVFQKWTDYFLNTKQAMCVSYLHEMKVNGLFFFDDQDLLAALYDKMRADLSGRALNPFKPQCKHRSKGIDLEVFTEMETQLKDTWLERVWQKGVAHSLRQALKVPPRTAEAPQIRAWLNDPQNIEAIQKVSELNLSRLGLRVVPEEVQKFTGVSNIDLSNNYIYSIPDGWLRSFSKLRQVNLCRNELVTFPSDISNLPVLEILNLSENHIPSIPRLPKSLKTLLMTHNHLRSLPAQIGELSNLVELNCSHNQVEQLPDQIGKLSHLFWLDVSHNRLRELPSTFGRLARLTGFQGSHNRLMGLPDTFPDCSALQSCEIAYNRIRTLPNEMCRLQLLDHLDLTSNEIIRLPITFGKLRNMSSLQLSDNQLKIFPVLNGDFSKLVSLNLSNNQLEILHFKAGSFRHLRILNAANNRLRTICDSIENLSSLQHCNVSGNQLDMFPEAVVRLKCLDSLKLADNRIRELPLGLENLSPTLMVLDLSGNQIEEIPNALCACSKLDTLDLSGNRLSNLPIGFQQLRGVKTLFLSHNRFHMVPDVVRRLPSLEILSLAHNLIERVESKGGFHNLRSVDFSSNLMSVSPEEALPSTLFVVNLAGNRIERLGGSWRKFLQIRRIDLSNNRLSEWPLEIEGLNTVKELNMAGNPCVHRLLANDDTGRLCRFTRALSKGAS